MTVSAASRTVCGAVFRLLNKLRGDCKRSLSRIRILRNTSRRRTARAPVPKVSFFYCDLAAGFRSTYFSTEGYYKNVGFTTADHERLRDTLKAVTGKFLLSYSDCPEIRELYSGYETYSYERLNNIRQRFDGGSMFGELLIANLCTDQ